MAKRKTKPTTKKKQPRRKNSSAKNRSRDLKSLNERVSELIVDELSKLEVDSIGYATLAERARDIVGCREYVIDDEQEELETIEMDELTPDDWFRIELIYSKLKQAGEYGDRASRLWFKTFITYLQCQNRSISFDDDVRH